MTTDTTAVKPGLPGADATAAAADQKQAVRVLEIRPFFTGQRCENPLEHARMPGEGELVLWRFHTASKHVRAITAETARAGAARAALRRYGASASHRQYVQTRACIEAIFSKVLGCTADQLQIEPDGMGRLRVTDRGGRPITVDYAMIGMWLVIGASRSEFALSVALNPPDEAHLSGNNLTGVRCRQAACARIASKPTDGPVDEASPSVPDDDASVHVLDIPMWGAMSAAVASFDTLTRIHAFGWNASM